MATKLIIEGNAVYEIDEDCLDYRQKSLHNQKNAVPKNAVPKNAVPKNNNGRNYRNKNGRNMQKDES